MHYPTAATATHLFDSRKWLQGIISAKAGVAMQMFEPMVHIVLPLGDMMKAVA
jgi:hypothetical protein